MSNSYIVIHPRGAPVKDEVLIEIYDNDENQTHGDNDSLAWLQHEVGGMIECVPGGASMGLSVVLPMLDDTVPEWADDDERVKMTEQPIQAVWCNEEGLLLGLDFNEVASALFAPHLLVGPVVIEYGSEHP